MSSSEFFFFLLDVQVVFGNLNYLRNKHYIVFLQNAKLRALLCEAVRIQWSLKQKNVIGCILLH